MPHMTELQLEHSASVEEPSVVSAGSLVAALQTLNSGRRKY